MGADLKAAKKVCKDDGTLFTAWCDSKESPVSYKTAQRLMAAHAEISEKGDLPLFGKYDTIDAFAGVIGRIAQTRDEDIRAALLEHIEKEAEDDRADVSTIVEK